MPNQAPVVEDVHQKVFLTVLRQVLPTVSRLDDARLVKKIGPEKFVDTCDELFGFIETGIPTPSQLTRLESEALASKLVICLKDYMLQAMKIPFTLKTILDCFGLLEQAVDCAFPGYHRSKLLKYTIAAKQ